MAELKKHALLLSLMLLLIVAKFVIVPIYDWQDTKLAEIELLTKKKMKIEGILQQETSFKESYDKLVAEVTQGDNAFFPYQKEADFKLSQQKLLEGILKKYNIKPSNIGWQITTPLVEYELMSYQIRIQFSGKTIDVINFINELEFYKYRVEIDDFYISVASQKNNDLGKSNGWFIIKFYADSRENQESLSDQKV